MYEDRLWVAFGSGQLLNEHVVSNSWPIKEERNVRLKEAIYIIKSLLTGQEFTY
ncbi:MAG: hypothetical protein K0R94_500 [Burkholderiales bacterium]|jgi:hypothetical protein|nr:hypothetical protein [Burkholderiales bacterium]